MIDARRAALVAAGAVVALAAASSLAFWWRLPARLPTDDDYRRANAHVEAALREGDIVVLAPAWAERGRPFLTAAPVFAGYDLARDTYPGTRRQWLVALADAPRFDLDAARAALKKRATASGPGERIGGLWVEPFEIAGPEPLFSFTERVADATVSIGGRSPQECRKNANGRHQCPRGEWNHVRAGWFEVRERPMRCVWAHPVGLEPVRIVFRDVPLGREIQGRAAFIGQTGKSGAAVDLGVLLDARELARHTFQPRIGAQEFSVTLPRTEGSGEIVFEVTSPDSGWRHFCFDAWVAR